MLAEIVELLACPHCGAELRETSGSLRCANAHTFDVARQGYVNLLSAGARVGTSDTPEMLAARDRFLGSGQFESLAVALADAAKAAAASCGGEPLSIVEIGAGTGFYLGRVLDALPLAIGLALDVSKHAARRAARTHPRAGAAVCDVWSGIPVRDGSAALVLDVFAPRNASEIERILRPDGSFIVATPTCRHLAELVAPLGMITVDGAKAERMSRALAESFELSSVERVEESMALTRAELEDLVSMGPSSRHMTAADIAARAAALPDPMRASLSVDIAVYQPRLAHRYPRS